MKQNLNATIKRHKIIINNKFIESLDDVDTFHYNCNKKHVNRCLTKIFRDLIIR